MMTKANMTNDREVIVSMTSFPQAIPYAVGAIRSILNGSLLPDRLILYLVFSQFGEAGIPDELLRLSEVNKIFEIRNYDRDLRSYLKLIPALAEFPEAIIVTVDDDIDYHPNMLRDLLTMHAKNPHAVWAHRVRHIKPGIPYDRWTKYRWYHFLFRRIHRGFANLQTGVGGVLYPPHSLRKDMLDVELFTKIAPRCDDFWFWAATVLNGVEVIPVPFGYSKPRELGKPKGISLMTINYKGGVDRNTLAFNAIMETYPEIKELIKKQ